jgi:NTE family protein
MHILNLALQGGGSHGAFTWGVLDALLEDGRTAFEGISGASAGALNAVALASGWASAEAAGLDPREGARAKLHAVWTRVSGWGSLGSLQQQFLRTLWGGWSADLAHGGALGRAWRGLVSPYQSNPLDLNPLRDLLGQEIDFEAIRGHRTLRVFVSATHVNTGKAVVFSGARLDARAVLASACLPMLFQAVEIDGEAYWDGGYSVNPPLSPLVADCAAEDVMLVQINPLRRDTVPRTATQIADRVNELTFNASLLTQMRAIDFVNRLVAEGAVSPSRCKTVRMHRIDGGTALSSLPVASRGTPDSAMIASLFDAGRLAAHEWLRLHFDALGREATVDIRRDYLDDTRMEVRRPAGARPAWPQSFQPWLARLLRRAG